MEQDYREREINGLRVQFIEGYVVFRRDDFEFWINRTGVSLKGIRAEIRQCLANGVANGHKSDYSEATRYYFGTNGCADLAVTDVNRKHVRYFLQALEYLKNCDTKILPFKNQRH